MTTDDRYHRPNPEVVSTVGDADHAKRLSLRLTLLLVFLLALAVRCFFLWGQVQNDPLIDFPILDAQVHHTWAEQIAAGEGVGEKPFFRAPLYYVLLGLLYSIARPEMLLGRIAGCLLGALSCVILVRLGTMIAGPRIGATAGVIAAIYWPLIYFDSQLLTVGLEVFLDLVLVLLLMKAREYTAPPLLIGAGIVWGSSAITRPNILALAPVILLWFLIGTTTRERLKSTLRCSLLIGLGAAMAILPVTIRNRVIGGEWVLIATNGGVNFFIGNNAAADGVTAIVPGTRLGWKGGYDDTHQIAEDALGKPLTESEVSEYWYASARDWIVAQPMDWLRLTVHKLRLFWSPFEIGNNQSIRLVAQQSPGMRFLFWLGFPVLSAGAATGLFLERRRWRSWILPLAFLVTYMATVIAFFCNARYRLPVIPILILLAAAAVVRFIDAIKDRQWFEVGGSMMVAGLGAVLVLTNPPSAVSHHRTNMANHLLRLAQFHEIPPPRGPGNDIKAIQYYRQVIQIWPKNLETRLALGRVYARQGSFSDAIEQFSAALKYHPDRLEPQLFLGRAYAWAGDFPSALITFEEAVQNDPDSAEAHQGLGCVLGAMGRPTEAVPHLQRALAINPDLVSARQCLERVQRPG